MQTLEEQRGNAAQYQREIRNKYVMLFREGIAREVLADILHSCGFPGTTGSVYQSIDPEDKAAIGRYNVGLEIAEKAGVLDAIGKHILIIKANE